MIECPVCKRANFDTEESCDCGYNFKTGEGRRPAQTRKQVIRRLASSAINMAKWAAGLGVLGLFVGFFGGAWATCRFFYPGTQEQDVCGYTGMATGLLGGMIGVMAGIVVARYRSMRKQYHQTNH
jgi:hypothetical protein